MMEGVDVTKPTESSELGLHVIKARKIVCKELFTVISLNNVDFLEFVE